MIFRDLGPLSSHFGPILSVELQTAPAGRIAGNATGDPGPVSITAFILVI
jgi:hypothetical protein